MVLSGMVGERSSRHLDAIAEIEISSGAPVFSSF